MVHCRLGSFGFASRRCRNREEEGAPASRRALDPDAATMGLDNPLDDRETQSDSVVPVILARLPELIEEVRSILDGDAESGVGDPEERTSGPCAAAPTVMRPPDPVN